MSNPWPAPDVAQTLYRRLRDDDGRDASADFAAAYLDPLLESLRLSHPGADDHALQTAAEDAVLSVIRNPDIYDPTRSPLRHFLCMAGGRDLANARQREWRHQKNREVRDCVELPADDGNSSTGDDDLPSFDAPNLAAVIAAFSDPERRVFDLMRGGERRTEVFAAALGIGDRPADEQEKEVKRAKDRIKVRLKRARREP